MLFEEKENSKEDDNSNNENEFKELYNEIDRVVHGEELSEGEESFGNNIKNSCNANALKHSRNSTEIIDDLNDYFIDIKENINNINNNINQGKKTINTINHLDNSKYINQSPQNLSSNFNKYQVDIIYHNIFKGSNNLQKNNFNSNYCKENCYIRNDYINHFQNNNDDSNINNKILNKGYNTDFIINPNVNLNQNCINNNYYKFSYNYFNQFNYLNINNCINSNNNKVELEQSINNKNNLINNFQNKRDIIRINYNINPLISPIREQLIEKIEPNHEKISFNNYNQIYNNNNYINNYININVPLASIPYNQFLLNNTINQNYIILNQINNLLNNPNINIYFQNNDLFNKNNNQIICEVKENNDETKLYKTKNKKDNQEKNNKINTNINYMNSFINYKIKKKSISDKTINNYNFEKNGYLKRKIFNPLPDSEKKKNIINIIDILQNKDTRTTLMIKNIPNKYTISTFLDEIGYYFKDTYDIFYLPIDYINKCNLGFAFINFVEPFHIILFYELYRGKKWKKFNSDKICELLYAKYQGKKELITHFEKGKIFSLDSEDKKPVILPTPNPLPKIKIPIYCLNIFIKLYPNISYEIVNYNNSSNNNSNFYDISFFSISGNFKEN